MPKLIKAILIFIVSCVVSYVVSALIVLATLYFFFRDVSPSMGKAFVLFGLLIPTMTIVMAVIGTVLIMKRGKKRVLLSEEKTDDEKQA